MHNLHCGSSESLEIFNSQRLMGNPDSLRSQLEVNVMLKRCPAVIAPRPPSQIFLVLKIVCFKGFIDFVFVFNDDGVMYVCFELVCGL